MELKDEVRRGEQARSLLENPLYIEAKEIVRQGIIDKWIECPVRDLEGQHSLKLMLKLYSDMVGYVEQVLQTGKLASIQLESEERTKKLRNAGL